MKVVNAGTDPKPIFYRGRNDEAPSEIAPHTAVILTDEQLADGVMFSSDVAKLGGRAKVAGDDGAKTDGESAGKGQATDQVNKANGANKNVGESKKADKK